MKKKVESFVIYSDFENMNWNVINDTQDVVITF